MKTVNEHQAIHHSIASASDAEWLWMLTEGREENPAKDYLPRLPDEQTQRRFVGKAFRDAFEVAINAFNVFLNEAENMGLKIDGNSRLLDFGCGWGRFSQVAQRHFSPERIYSVDVQKEALELCRNSGLRTNLVQVPMLPPSDIEAESIDLVIAYSVFSHLSEEVHWAWLQEFLRILRPSGVLAVTTRHRGFIKYAESLRGQNNLPPHAVGLANISWNAQAALDAYDRGEYVYGEYPEGGRIGKGYGEACISFAYARDNWSNLFDKISFVEANAKIDQSVIVARKVPS